MLTNIDILTQDSIFTHTYKKGLLKNTYNYHVNQQKSIARSQRRKEFIKEKYKKRYRERVKSQLSITHDEKIANKTVKENMKKEKENYHKFIDFKRNREFLNSMYEDLIQVHNEYINKDNAFNYIDKLNIEFNYIDVMLSLQYYIIHYQKKYNWYETIKLLLFKLDQSSETFHIFHNLLSYKWSEFYV